MKAVTQLPLLLIYRLKSQRLFSQDFRDVEELTLPLDLAVVAHLPHRDSRLVLNLWEFDWIGPWRRAINTAWSFSSQRLMRTLPVVLLSKGIEVALLCGKSFLRWHCFLQRSVDALVATVLCGFARTNPLGFDPKPYPPFRELADPAHRQRRKRCSVIGTNGLRQPVLPKDPLKPRSNRLMARPLKPPAQKQISREVVAEGQRIATPSVAQPKVSLEVRTPTLIRPPTLAKRLCVGSYPVPTQPWLNQPRTLENLTHRRIHGPVHLRLLTTQVVHHLLRTPSLMTELSLYDHRPQLLRGLIGVGVWHAREFFKPLDPSFPITLNPLVSRRSADPITSAQFTLAVVSAQPISYQLNSLFHGTGFLPRHRQSPPCRSTVNHVPGLFCKSCYQFVPHLIPLPSRERKFVAASSALCPRHPSTLAESALLRVIYGRIRWRVCRSPDLSSRRFPRQFCRTNQQRPFGRLAFVQH